MANLMRLTDGTSSFDFSPCEAPNQPRKYKELRETALGGQDYIYSYHSPQMRPVRSWDIKLPALPKADAHRLNAWRKHNVPLTFFPDLDGKPSQTYKVRIDSSDNPFDKMQGPVWNERFSGSLGLTQVDPKSDIDLSVHRPIFQFTPARGLNDLAGGRAISFQRNGEACMLTSDNVLVQAPINQHRVTGGLLLLEGVATNKCACVKHNPDAVNNLSKGGAASATLTAVSDSSALIAAGLSSFGPNVYCLNNSLGSSSATVTIEGPTGNLNAHSISVYARGSGNCDLRLEGGVNAGTALRSVYQRLSRESIIPGDSTKRLMLEIAAGATVYFTLPQIEEGPVCTSPIAGGSGPISRANEGGDPDAGGLQANLTPSLLNILACEICPNRDFSGVYVNGQAPSWIKNASWGTASLSEETSDTNGSAKVQHVTIPAENSTNALCFTSNLTAGVNYTIEIQAKLLTGLTPNYFKILRASDPYDTLATFDLNLTSSWSKSTFTFSVNESVAVNVLIGCAANRASSFLIGRCSLRRNIAGKAGRGEGTLLQAVELPWPTTAMPNDTSVGLQTTWLGQTLYLQRANNTFAIMSSDGQNYAGWSQGELPAGRYVVALQFSAVTGQKRVGLYKPANQELLWGAWSSYRGYFPVHASNKLRAFYGGGALPIKLGQVRVYDSPISDQQLEPALLHRSLTDDKLKLLAAEL